VSSRLSDDGRGGLVVVVTTSSDVGARVGERFRAIGNDLAAAEHGIGWLGRERRPKGRPPALRARATSRI
jgi:hypothetical protein